MEYQHRLAVILCLMILLQQVVGKVEERRRYQSAFEDLFFSGKLAFQNLLLFHQTVKGNKELHQSTTKVTDFVKANPDKVGLGLGLAASSWLLYQSIVLANEVERFFNEIEELKGQFRQYYLHKVNTLTELFEKTKEVVDSDTERQKEHFRDIYKKLMEYYQDLQRMMDDVDDMFDDVRKARSDAVVSSAVSFSVTAFTGAALVVGGPITLPPMVWSAGMSTTMVMSSASTALSLKNANDIDKAVDKLEIVKRGMRQLRDQVMEKMMKIIEFT